MPHDRGESPPRLRIINVVADDAEADDEEFLIALQPMSRAELAWRTVVAALAVGIGFAAVALLAWAPPELTIAWHW